MKAGNFTGITGFPNQDIAMWVTMGPIAERPREKLGASDLAIVEFRRRMLDALEDFQDNQEVIALNEHAIPKSHCSFQSIIPKIVDWRDFAASPIWNTPSNASDAEADAADATSYVTPSR